jgi:hypothetical protein
MKVLERKMAPRSWNLPEPGPKERGPMDVHNISPAGDPFHAAAQDRDHPHTCDGGWVTLGQLVVDPETGEETEEFALYLCRKCAEQG